MEKRVASTTFTECIRVERFGNISRLSPVPKPAITLSEEMNWWFNAERFWMYKKLSHIQTLRNNLALVWKSKGLEISHSNSQCSQIRYEACCSIEEIIKIIKNNIRWNILHINKIKKPNRKITFKKSEEYKKNHWKPNNDGEWTIFKKWIHIIMKYYSLLNFLLIITSAINLPKTSKWLSTLSNLKYISLFENT